jgi:chromosome segregation protein
LPPRCRPPPRAAAALAIGEAQLRQSADASRLADSALAETRERLARLEALRDSAAEALARLVREIRERVDTGPEALGELAGLTGSEAPVDPAETAARLDRLIRERDGMSPVKVRIGPAAVREPASVLMLGVGLLEV